MIVMLEKMPAFLISYSRVNNREFIIYTKEPKLFCEVFICHSEAQERETREKYTTVTETEYKGVRALIVVFEVCGSPKSIEEVEKPLKRMADWYHGILKEKLNNS